MRVDLPEDPAVYRLATITKLDRLSVVGRLYAFWAWADRHAVDGHVDGATSTVVDDITRHDGFAKALESVGWLVISEDSITLPKHDRHNGESAKERSQKNARQSRWREKKKDVDAKTSTQPSTREEKRREDIKTKTKAQDFVPPCPKSVERETWDAFLELRKKKRAPITEHAYTLLVRSLAAERISGRSPDELVKRTVMNGWTGLFPDKPQGANGNGKFNVHAYTRGKLAEALASEAVGTGAAQEVESALPSQVHEFLPRSGNG